jgi:tetratricopeptide (TPR) repeat protein
MLLPTLALLAAGKLAAPAPAGAKAPDLDPVVQEAILFYDKGAYEDAKRDLEGLDAAGAADGPLLYRLFFCERATGHEDAAHDALVRAAKALEQELPSAKTLDTPFYLANAYANLGRAADAQNVAKSAIDNVEKKRWKVPETPIGLFQLGKLYQDAGRSGEAASYYAKALDGFDLKGGRYLGNARWALRFIGNTAFARGDYAASESAFVRLTQLGEALSSDWSALATARVRSGKYAAAAEAWKAAVRLDPAGADDARYSARLADVAATLGPLPAADGAGAAFASMQQAALETALKDQAGAVRAVQSRAAEALRTATAATPPHGMDAKLRSELTDTLSKTRRVFVAAGLEYSVRHFPIRETAFREGYAVLIFQDSEWTLPPDPEVADSKKAGS